MEIIKRGDCIPFITKDTSEIRELMAYRNSSCKRVSLAEAIIRHGQKTELHFHPKCEEIYYVLSGHGLLRSGDDYRDIVAGDCILHPPGALHQAWNKGESDLVILCVCAPAYENDDTVIVEQ